MPPRLTYPGVYVEEKSSGVKTITGVATSTTLFVGMARKGGVGRPTPIRGVDQFEQTFGDDTAYGEMVPQVRQFFLNGGADAIVVRIAANDAAPASVNLRSSGGASVLALNAKSEGTFGSEIRAIVDYDTPTPELTFNIELFRRSVDANGATEVSENEFFGNLTMDPTSPRYAVTLLSDDSALINAALPGGALATTNAGFSQSALLLPMDDPGTIAVLDPLLAEGNRIVISVDGGAAVNVTLPSPVGDVPTWLGEVSSLIDAALVANAQPGNVTASLAGFGASRALRLEASGPEPDSVVVTNASQSNGAAPLQLGSAIGGIEIGRYSRYRPAPTGFTTALHSSSSNTFAQNSNLSRLVTFAEETRANFTLWTFTDGTGNPAVTAVAAPAFSGVGARFIEGDVSSVGDGSLRNTATHLDTIVGSLATGLGQGWTVRRTGYRITLTPNFGTSNTGTAATLTSAGGYDIGGAGGMALGANAANAQAYALGASGTGSFQIAGAAGDNGGVPDLTQYNDVFSTVTSEVDIFNLLTLPRGFEQTDEQRALLWGSASAFCQRERAFLIVDPPAKWENVDDANNGIEDMRLGAVTDHAGLYWPRINVASAPRPVDPAGTVAGIMSRTDTRRGVWKAAAGLEASILGATGLEYLVSDVENGVTNPQAINTLRRFSSGAVIWGSRTMAGFDNSGESDYNHIPVRRTALFIEESLYRGLKFAVFEPNDEPLWAQIRLAAGVFMQNLFRQGAFQGSKASDAYDVRCDASTTTQNDINLGRVNVIVSFAPLRPAEFVVLTVRQLAGQIQV